MHYALKDPTLFIMLLLLQEIACKTVAFEFQLYFVWYSKQIFLRNLHFEIFANYNIRAKLCKSTL